MTNSFGAGFFTLTLLAALAGLAGLLGLTAVAAVALRRRSGQVPPLLRYVAVALLVGVVVPAAFGVLVLYDESAVGAGLLLAVVFAPLAAVGFRYRDSTAGWVTPLATAGLSWSLPYLLGVITFIGLNAVIPQSFDLAPGEARSVGVGWIAAAGAGVVVVGGALLLGGGLVRWLSPSTSS